MATWIRAASVCALALLGSAHCRQDTRPDPYQIPETRERLALREAIVREKLERSLPLALRNQGIDLWLTFERENQPDPLHDDLGGGHSDSGALFIFFDDGERVEKIYLGASEQPLDSVISRDFDVLSFHRGSREELKRSLYELVRARDPETIGINVSQDSPVADGLTASSRVFLVEALGALYADRLRSAEGVAHEFRARRTPLETEWYRRLQEWTSRLQTEALVRHLEPGRTTVLDLVAFVEDRAHSLGMSLARDHGRYPLIVWYGDRGAMPGLAFFDRPRIPPADPSQWTDARDFAIEPGDLVTLDGGLRFLTFATDMKRSAYLLRLGESAPPNSLLAAWRDVLEIAQLYRRNLLPGSVGRELWQALASQLQSGGFSVAGSSEEIQGERGRVGLFGHAVGNVPHDIGLRIGPGDASSGKEFPLIPGEWISVEFYLVAPNRELPGREWFVRFEQTGRVTDEGLEWLVPLQEELFVVPPPT